MGSRVKGKLDRLLRENRGASTHAIAVQVDGQAVASAARAASRTMEAAPERVNHPAHYGGADDPYEAIKVIEAWGAGFNVGSALKYLRRAGRKPEAAELEDLRKARFYIDREIALAEGRRPAEEARSLFRDREAFNSTVRALGTAVGLTTSTGPTGALLDAILAGDVDTVRTILMPEPAPLEGPKRVRVRKGARR